MLCNLLVSILFAAASVADGRPLQTHLQKDGSHYGNSGSSYKTFGLASSKHQTLDYYRQGVSHYNYSEPHSSDDDPQQDVTRSRINNHHDPRSATLYSPQLQPSVSHYRYLETLSPAYDPHQTQRDVSHYQFDNSREPRSATFHAPQQIGKGVSHYNYREPRHLASQLRSFFRKHRKAAKTSGLLVRYFLIMESLRKVGKLIFPGLRVADNVDQWAIAKTIQQILKE